MADEGGLLHKLCKTRKPSKFQSILKKANEKEIKGLVSGIVNVMKKKVPISKRRACMIRKNRRMLRHLVHPTYSWKSKRRYLLQHGGGGGWARIAADLGKIARVAERAAPALRRVSSTALARTARSPIVTRSAATATAREAAQASRSKSLTSLASSASGRGGSAFTRGVHRASKRISKAAHTVGRSPFGKVAKTLVAPVRRPYKAAKKRMTQRQKNVAKIAAGDYRCWRYNDWNGSVG